MGYDAANGSYTSFEDAVLMANDSPGADTIVFGSEFQSDPPQTMDAWGSINISDDVTIEAFNAMVNRLSPEQLAFATQNPQVQTLKALLEGLSEAIARG